MMGSRRRAYALTGLACAFALLAATSCASSKAKANGTPIPSAYPVGGSLAGGTLSMRDSAGDTMTLRQGSAADYHSACAAQSTATPVA